MPPAARLRRIVTGKGGAKERAVEDGRGREQDGVKGTEGKRERGRATGAGIKKAQKRVRKEGREEDEFELR